MTTIRKAHRKRYSARQDLAARRKALMSLIRVLRDSELPTDIKKRMLNHAIWEITVALGNFTPEFRSKGVLEGAIGTKIEREHVFKRKAIVSNILARNAPLETVLLSVIHCVVTKEEHAKLKAVLDSEDGWERYHLAGIEVFSMSHETPRKIAYDQAQS